MPEEAKDTQAEVNPVKDEEPKDNLPENQVSVEEIGTLKKKVTVTIPRERIDAKRDEMFGELSGSAQVPGFRVGRAPRRLIEKRFGKEVAEDVRNALIGESLGQALEKSEIKTIGEPDIDLDKIKLPDTGDMEFSFETEVAPEFDLPEQKGIEVTKPKAEITDEHVSQQIDQWRQRQATFEATDQAAQADDAVTAGAKIQVEGIAEPVDRPGLSLRVAPGQIEGIPLLELGKELTGKSAGQVAKFEVKVNEAHPNEQWRGKKATIEVAIGQVRKQILPAVDDELAKKAGFESLDELRDLLRSRAEAQLAGETKRVLQTQIEQYLLDNTEFDLPEAMTQRHTERLLQRRYVKLLEQGIPKQQIDQRLTELQAAAGEQAKRDLKLRFILEKVAEERKVEVTGDELNSRVAEIASLYNRRPERLRQELAADGTLQQLQASMVEEKSIEALLEDAKITEAKDKQPKAKKKASKKAGKKTSKKAAKKSAKKTTKKPEDKTKKAVKKAKKSSAKK